MRKNLLYILLLGVFGLFMQSCQNTPEFPDPGFELTDQRVEVRRDTADYYDIKMQMKVPNKVKEIVILDATDYSLVETIDSYNGKTNFQFDYRVDISSIEEDTVLNYIIKVTDQEGRSFNRGIRISVKRFSFPEIKLTGGTNIAVAAPAYYVKGTVSTGLNTIASVKVVFQGAEQYTYTPADGEALHEMPLKALVFFGTLDPNLSYPINIIITDDQGQESTTVITVRKSNEFLKPTRINYRNASNILIYIIPTYDSEGKITAYDFNWTNTGNNYRQEFKYNDMDMVTEIKYSSIDANGYKSSDLIHTVTYVTGTKKIAKIESEDIDYLTDGSTSTTGVLIESSLWTYDSNNKLTDIKVGTSSIKSVYFSDPFNLGENVFGDYWQSTSTTYATSTNRRQKRTEYDPILMPTYMEGLPVFFKTSSVLLNVYNDLFQCKYVPVRTENYIIPPSTSALLGPELPTYTYETDNDGNLTTIYKQNNYSKKTETYSFFYD
jgi:hypothetical protein